MPADSSSAPPSGVAVASARLARTDTRTDEVVDDLHGVRVPDPYRWLEAGEQAEVQAWTDAQNARTRAYLDAIPTHAARTARLREILRVGTVDLPAVVRRHGAKTLYFHTKRRGGESQPILYVREGVEGNDRALIDLNVERPARARRTTDGDAGTHDLPTREAGAPDDTRSLDWWYPSWDGRLLAWGSSTGGDEESTLRVRDVASGADRDERIPRTRHASVAWLPDGSGFYYSRYPLRGTVPPGDESYSCAIHFHRLGTRWEDDPKVFSRPVKTDLPQVLLSPDGRRLVVRVHIGWDRSDVYVRDRAAGEKAPWVPVAEGLPSLYDPDPQDDVLYLRTNDGAPRYRFVAVDYAKPARDAWRTVIPEGEDALDGVTRIGKSLFAAYLHEASTRVARFDREGHAHGGGEAVALPGIGSAGVSGAHDGEEAFLSFTSFVTPPSILRLDLTKAGAMPQPWDRVGDDLAGAPLPRADVKLLHATSRDGTRVPMFVVRAAGADGSSDASKPVPRPAILWGYGGFNVNQTPAFSARVIATLEAGGVWVTAVLRGGGELGEAWHEAGMRAKKQNVFDDYLACAEALVAQGITTRGKLAAMGGSNGGLLVSAAITQRPELFRAAVALVPLTDMLRFPRFRIGRLWTSEYGDPDVPADFPFIYAYSPYHHVRPGTAYPATLLTTAEGDSRVDPMHARKMAARLEAAQADPARPILLRVERNAGHGAGKPASRLAEEMGDELSFVFHELAR